MGAKHVVLLLLITLSYHFESSAKNLNADSAKYATRKKSRQVKVGDHDFHKFGNVIIAADSGRYSITFPFFQYTDTVRFYETKDDILPAGTPLTLILDDGQSVQAETNGPVKVLWYYWFDGDVTPDFKKDYIDPVHLTKDKLNYTHYYNGIDSFGKPYYFNYDAGRYANFYGMSWLVTFNFTRAEMLLMQEHLVVSASIRNKPGRIALPLKHKQSVKIRKAITRVLD